jgi:DNA-binding NtrC family response regulator
LPPLRDRREDIPILAQHFLAQLAKKYDKESAGFDAAAMQALAQHRWPGNVRELQHVVERSILMAVGNTITVEDLGLRSRSDGATRLEEMTLEDAEEYLIRKALERYDGNVSDAAQALGLSRSALYRRVQRHGL